MSMYNIDIFSHFILYVFHNTRANSFFYCATAKPFVFSSLSDSFLEDFRAKKRTFLYIKRIFIFVSQKQPHPLPKDCGYSITYFETNRLFC